MVRGVVNPPDQSESPVVLSLGEIELTIRGLEREVANAVALEQIPALFKQGLRREAFLFSVVAQFELEEIEAHFSDRKSRSRLRLRLPDIPKWMLWLSLGTGPIFGDYEQAGENLEAVREKAVVIAESALAYVQDTLTLEGIDLEIEYNPDVVLGRPPKVPGENDDEESH